MSAASRRRHNSLVIISANSNRYACTIELSSELDIGRFCASAVRRPLDRCPTVHGLVLERRSQMVIRGLFVAERVNRGSLVTGPGGRVLRGEIQRYGPGVQQAAHGRWF